MPGVGVDDERGAAMSHAPPPLPKAGSAPQKQLWEDLKRALDAPRTILVLEGALDRKSLEEVLQKQMRGAAPRPGQMPRAELVGRLADAFHRNADIAFALMKELDRGCHKERHIVASIDEAHVDERLATYRALDFRRERARIVWALLRDGREAHKKAADKVLTEAFAQVQKAADAHAAAASADAGDGAPGGGVEERLTTYEKALEQQQRELKAAVGVKESAERERSELMVRLGQRERALREEEELRRSVEAERDKLRAELESVRAALEQSQPARLSSTLEELERMKEKNRSLEARAERAARLAELEEELAAHARAHDDAARGWQRAREELEEQLRLIAGREAAAQERIAGLREELKAARRQLAAADGGAPAGAVEGGAAGDAARVGVFVDAANLSASARRDFGSKLDYRALLDEVLDKRNKASAVAFVVKDGDEGLHQGFVKSLREAGYDVREKRPKERSDGSRKADWDMGIAMEILDQLDDVDVVVLCSGDGDFIPLVQRLKRERKRVEVAAFRASTDDALIRAADAFVPLDGRFRMTT